MAKKFQMNPLEADRTPAPDMPEKLSEIEARQFGGAGVTVPSSGKQVALPVDLTTIYPDLRQPRRAIPANFRGQWNGQPSGIPELLKKWHSDTNMRWQVDVDLAKLLRGMGDGIEQYAADDVAALDYLDLVGLAASIYKEGLTNPITVVRRNVGDSYLLVAGERRLLAHWLLATYVDDKFARIPARVVDSFDVWQQASENGARKPLNAIGMARQLALLIMDMYAGDDGVRFDEFESIILPGECDRKFYAQVGNGEIYRIKKGMGQRICDVTGLKSKQQVQQYRGLLNIPDELWTEADLNNWAEFRIRELIQSIRAMPDRSTTVDLSDADTLTPVKVSPAAIPQNAQEYYDNSPVYQQIERNHAAPQTPRSTPNQEGKQPASQTPLSALLLAPGAWQKFFQPWRGQYDRRAILLVEQNGVHLAFGNDAYTVAGIVGISPYTLAHGENAQLVLKIGGELLEHLERKSKINLIPFTRLEGAIKQLYQMAFRSDARWHDSLPAPVPDYVEAAPTTAAEAEVAHIQPQQLDKLTSIYGHLHDMALQLTDADKLVMSNVAKSLKKLHEQIPALAQQGITSREAARVLANRMDGWHDDALDFMEHLKREINAHVKTVKAAIDIKEL